VVAGSGGREVVGGTILFVTFLGCVGEGLFLGVLTLVLFYFSSLRFRMSRVVLFSLVSSCVLERGCCYGVLVVLHC
jgi:hypothetical protein